MLRVKTDVYKSSTITTANGKTMKQKDIISSYENNKTKIIKRATSVNPEATIFKVTQHKINKNKSSKEDGLRKKLKQLLIHQFENQFKKSDILKEKRKTTSKKPVKKTTVKKPAKKSTAKKPVKKTTKRKKTKMESK